jgi:hypothetical protein
MCLFSPQQRQHVGGVHKVTTGRHCDTDQQHDPLGVILDILGGILGFATRKVICDRLCPKQEFFCILDDLQMSHCAIV